MDKQRYMISDAASIVDVESHVLRYWEDELELTVPRNEMGHRYYTKENIREFMQIKELKEQGYQLKAIKMILHNEDPGVLFPEQNTMPNQVPDQIQGGGRNDMQNGHTPMGDYGLQQPLHNAGGSQLTGENMYRGQARLDQFQEMMAQIVRQAIADNNQALGQKVGEEVGVKVIKEMNYLIREQDEQAENRYRRLDEAIRTTCAKKGRSGKLFGKKQELKPKEA